MGDESRFSSIQDSLDCLNRRLIAVEQKQMTCNAEPAPAPEPERPEWWGGHLQPTTDHGLDIRVAEGFYNNLILSHNARLAAEARVAELEKRVGRAESRRSHMGVVAREEVERANAAEAELRRLRQHLRNDWPDFSPAAFVLGAVEDSESRYPLPAEGEHRGSRR